MASLDKVTFRGSSAFHCELKRRVEAYFARAEISRHANAAMVAKTVFWLALTWGTWAAILTGAVAFPASILLWVVFGFGLAGIGINIGHDALHQAYSKKRWVNAFLAWSFDMMGASSAMWNLTHNVVHHTFTNVAVVDNDIEPGPFLAFYHRPDTKPWHRVQHVYAWGLYALVALMWMYLYDFSRLLQRDPRTGKRALPRDVVKTFIGKAAHLVLMLAIPLWLLPNPAQVLVGYLAAMLTAGFSMALVFQLGHIVENVVAVKLEPGQMHIDSGWADHQLRTTANFGGSALSTFFTGGLDHQIEHHLFPRICHVHYPKLAPIVRACALEFGLPYLHSGSFIAAVASHARVMRQIGRRQHPHLLVPAVALHDALDCAAQ